MKKLLSFILSFLMVVSSFIAIFSISTIATSENLFTFEIVEKEAILSNCNKNASGKIIIPQTYEGLPVTFIDNESFLDCNEVTEVVIPNTVRKICFRAFSNCKNLSKINFPGSLKVIDHEAFLNCTQLTDIDLPNFIEEIGSDTFKNTAYYNDPLNWEDNILYSGQFLIDIKESDTNTIHVKSGTKYIAPSAFAFQKNVSNIFLPDSIERISAYILDNTEFYKNKANWENGVLYVNNILIAINEDIPENYTIKQGTKVIAGSAFSFNEKIKKIIIPDSVHLIDAHTFGSCPNLSTVILNDGIKSIGELAFFRCTNLSKVVFGNSIENIGSNAFANCDALTEIVFPTGLKNIGKYSFSQCKNLKIVSNMTGIETIGKYAFYNCNKLTETGKIEAKQIGDFAFYECASLKKVEIGDSVEKIGTGAFSKCGANTIIVGENVTSIGNYAFYDCYALKDIYYGKNIKEVEEHSLPSNFHAVIHCYKGTLAEDHAKSKNLIYKLIDGNFFDKLYLFFRNNYLNLLSFDFRIIGF